MTKRHALLATSTLRSLMTAVAHYLQDIGIGIGEDTAILVNNGTEFRVLGSGSAIIVDGGPITHTNLADLKHGELLELHDLSLQVLPAGARYDLRKQRSSSNAASTAPQHSLGSNPSGANGTIQRV